jgi:GNAT superfamily N-acetyltransferase
MENNQWTFCSLWADHSKIKNCADMFINKKLAGDYFFNRLDNIACYDIESVIKESVKVFLEYGLNCYVYVQKNDLNLEKMLLKMDFTQLDIMQVLESNFTKTGTHDDQKIHVSMIDIGSLPVWIDVFCRSFDVTDWKSEVERIIKKHFDELTLLVSYVENNQSIIPAGCCALFNRYSLMGLYCLGTLESFRGKGLAKKMITVSSDVARRQNLGSLFLQTFTNERLTHFYKKMGFEVAYKKKIYMLTK